MGWKESSDASLSELRDFVRGGGSRLPKLWTPEQRMCRTILQDHTWGVSTLVKGAVPIGEFGLDPYTLIRIENLKNVFKSDICRPIWDEQTQPGSGRLQRSRTERMKMAAQMACSRRSVVLAIRLRLFSTIHLQLSISYQPTRMAPHTRRRHKL